MDPFYLTRLFIKQCDEILGTLPSQKEKRELLLTLLLLYCLSSFSKRKRLTSKETEESVLQPQNLHSMDLSFSQMWENCVSADEPFVMHHLAHMIFNVTRQIPELRSLLDSDWIPDRITNQQLKQLLLFFNRFFHDEMQEIGAAEIFEAIVERYSREVSSGTGSFYAPRDVTELLADLVQPESGTLYDPCCGCSNMLISFANRMLNRGADFQIYGRESNSDAWKLANLNLLFRGFSADLGSSPSYALMDNESKILQADYIVSNPPFNDRFWSDNYEELKYRPFLRYGVPPKKRGSLAWLQYMLYTLKPGGKLVTLLNVSTLDSSYDSEKRIRMGLVKDNLLRAIILLPAGLFWGTEIPVALFVLQNGGKSGLCGNRILMVDGSHLGTEIEKKVQLTEQDHQAILAVWNAYQQGEAPEQIGFCTTVSAAEVAEQDGTLYPKDYISYEKETLPTWETLLEKESSLQMELERQLQENAVLLQQICHQYQEV